MNTEKRAQNAFVLGLAGGLLLGWAAYKLDVPGLLPWMGGVFAIMSGKL